MRSRQESKESLDFGDVVKLLHRKSGNERCEGQIRGGGTRERRVR